jgi:hypothetical protein
MIRHRARRILPAVLAATFAALLTPAIAQAAVTNPHAITAPRAIATSPSPDRIAVAGSRSVGLIPIDNCGPGTPGYQCDQTDPYATGCANSRVYVKSGTATYGNSLWQEQLWYSTRCRTVWSRLQLLRGTDGCGSCYLMVIRDEPSTGNDYAESDVGSPGGTLYSGAWSNQLFLPCGGSLQSYSEVWNYYYGNLGNSNWWYPGC